jgi:hypothetical protein
MIFSGFPIVAQFVGLDVKSVVIDENLNIKLHLNGKS